MGSGTQSFSSLLSKRLKHMIHLACQRNRGAVGSLRRQTDAGMKGDLVIFIHPSSNLLGDEPELLGVVCVVIVFFFIFF